MKETLCATCEFLGNAVFPVVDYWNKENGGIKPKFIGFADRPNGNRTDNPSRRCNHEKMKKSLVYEFLDFDMPCQYYKKRNWQRPLTCGECDLRYVRNDNRPFTCSGYPFTNTHNKTDKACINGKTTFGTQFTLF